jgi:hypothetical protein
MVCGAQGEVRGAIPLARRMQPASRIPKGIIRKKEAGMERGGA